MKILALAIGVFLLSLAVDFAWSKYMLEAAAKHAHRAATWSAAILLLGSISVLVYVEAHWTLVPMLAGGYTGTYLAVKRAK